MERRQALALKKLSLFYVFDRFSEKKFHGTRVRKVAPSTRKQAFLIGKRRKRSIGGASAGARKGKSRTAKKVSSPLNFQGIKFWTVADDHLDCSDLSVI